MSRGSGIISIYKSGLMSKHSSKQKGYTLIELMISASVMGFIMSALALMIFMGVRQFRMQSQRIEMSSQSRSAVEIMTYQIRMAKASSIKIKSSMAVAGGEVKFGHIVFEDYGNDWWHSIYLEQTDNLKPGRLVYEYENSGAGPAIIKKILATGVSSILFSYPNSQNPRKIEINLGLARPIYENRVITTQIREVIEVRNP